MSGRRQISSWLDLAKLVQDCSDGSWLFRGESSVGRPLLPKAGRVGSYSGAARKREYVLEDEKRVLEAFKKQARPHLNHTPASDMEWLAIAQHHGMSTRLLDWTESLLVAAYFASCQAGARGDALIYGARGLRTLTREEESDPFLVSSPALYRPPHISPRIPAQRSVFTIHANPTDTFAPAEMTEWQIAGDVCGKIKSILDACAINEASLFPDLDGLSRYLGWRYKWAKP